MSERRSYVEEHPIYPAEIERYRESLQIGQKIILKIREQDLNFRWKTVYRQCTIIEKHRWLFLVRDTRGKLYTMTYIDMMVNGNKET